MKNLKKKGFTIVELVIVIAVVAVLAAVLIPTFSNLIRKANESVDIQLVRNMNVILEQDEALNGKPADIEKVKDILSKNGIVNPTPAYSESAFAWDNEENVIVLINSNTQKGVFPKEYEDVPYKDTWELLAGTVNVTLEDLGVDSLAEALEKVELGQTIVLTKDEQLTVRTLPKNLNIDLGEKTLDLTQEYDTDEKGNRITPLMEEYSNITFSNGTIKSTQITNSTGSTLTLNNVIVDSTSSCALYPGGLGSRLNINGGKIYANTAIGTAYSDQSNRAVQMNISGVEFGSVSKPCKVGISMITSGDITISGCTIYATDKGIYNRSGNMIVKDTDINYQPSGDYVDTYLGNEGQEYTTQTPTGYKSWHWLGGSSGVNAPIVVGDFRANHYSFDANCTLVNVTVNCTNDTYPDVYLSQEKYDVCYYNKSTESYTGEKVEGPVACKTTLTCDETITWAVNPGKTDAYKTAEFVTNVTNKGLPTEFLDEKYSGYEFSNSGHGGLALLYIDNVFVNGVEQAKGSTSSNQVPAN